MFTTLLVNLVNFSRADRLPDFMHVWRLEMLIQMVPDQPHILKLLYLMYLVDGQVLRKSYVLVQLRNILCVIFRCVSVTASKCDGTFIFLRLQYLMHLDR